MADEIKQEDLDAVKAEIESTQAHIASIEGQIRTVENKLDDKAEMDDFQISEAKQVEIVERVDVLDNLVSDIKGRVAVLENTLDNLNIGDFEVEEIPT